MTGWDTTAPDTNIPTETVYDADGHVIRSIIAGGVPGDPALVTKTTYDPMGRVTGAIVVNDVAGAGTGDTVTNLTTSSTWDNLGRVTDAYDPAGTRTRYEYDRLGRTTGRP